MRIASFLHKGLKRLYSDDNPKGLPPESINKLKNMLAFLEDMADPDELRTLPTWKAHRLTGARAGIWSLHVTRNWRLTFRVDRESVTISDLDLEDYH